MSADLTRPVELAARAVYDRAVANRKVSAGRPTPLPIWAHLPAANRHALGEQVLPVVAAAEPALTAQAFRRAAVEIGRVGWPTPEIAAAQDRLRELADQADPPQL